MSVNAKQNGSLKKLANLGMDALETIIKKLFKNADEQSFPMPSDSAEGLNLLKNVSIDTPTDGQVLKYDATNQEWVNANSDGGHDIIFGSTTPSASIGNEADVYIKTPIGVSYRVYTTSTSGSDASIAVDTLNDGVVINTDSIPYQNPNRTYPDFTISYGSPSYNWKVSITTANVTGYNQGDNITWMYNATQDVTLNIGSQLTYEVYIKHNGSWIKLV